jgi:hypothetical protein
MEMALRSPMGASKIKKIAGGDLAKPVIVGDRPQGVPTAQNLTQID